QRGLFSHHAANEEPRHDLLHKIEDKLHIPHKEGGHDYSKDERKYQHHNYDDLHADQQVHNSEHEGHYNDPLLGSEYDPNARHEEMRPKKVLGVPLEPKSKRYSKEFQESEGYGKYGRVGDAHHPIVEAHRRSSVDNRKSGEYRPSGDYRRSGDFTRSRASTLETGERDFTRPRAGTLETGERGEFSRSQGPYRQ
ncbi:hypothetical protein LTS18_005230, partial [Coniosporium uncinatum]